MRSPELAIAYAVWARNRTGFLICAAGLAAMALVYPAIFAFSRTWGTLVASTIPLFAIFPYVLNASIFAQEPGSLASSYPRHMLVLPVKTRTLVFWPMFYGSLMAVCLWAVTVKVVYRSSGLAIPLEMPALALVAIVSWFQALAWIPLAARTTRALIALFVTLLLGSPVVWIILNDTSANFLVIAVLLVYLAAAYAVAVAAIRADRRGEDWRLWFSMARPGPSVDPAVSLRSARPFRSAAMAQFWYEWRCHATFALGFLGVEMLAIWGVVLTVPARIDATRIPLIVGLLLAAPVLTVGSMGPGISRFRPPLADYRGLTTFLMVRPITGGGLVAAKLRMALVCVISSWLFILAGTTACILLKGGLSGAIIAWHRFQSLYPGGRAAAICGLTCVLIPGLMWKLLTDGFPHVLTGRKWIADGAVFIYAAGLVGLVSAAHWLSTHPEQLPRVLSIAPWLVVFGAIVKAGVAVAAFRTAMRRGLIGWPEFWRVLAGWSAFAGLAIALAMLVKPPTGFVSKPILFLSIATFAPLGRFPLASVAVDWNRHR
jgi:hypothetical protein